MNIGRMRKFMLVLVLLAFFASSAFAGLPVPERGFISSDPGRTWEEGLISGNGTVGVNIQGQPLEDTIIFTHERMFLPQGPPHIPPYQADRLFEIRRLIDQGMYRQATALASQLSDQDEKFMYPDNFVPCFDMNIKMDSKGDVKDYMRSVDFETGETVVHWADDRGVFERRCFVSRPDGVAVMLITGPEGSVSCEMNLGPRKPKAILTEGAYRGIEKSVVERSNEKFKELVTDVKAAADDYGLTFFSRFTKAYPGSIQSLNGTARVIVRGGSKSADGDTLKVKDADSVMVIVDIRPIYKGFRPDNPEQDPSPAFFEETKLKLAKMGSNYKRMLDKHAAIHGEMFNRMRLDIGGGAEHRLTSEMLLDKTSNENVNKALIEKTFDAGRYNIISCTGELPPNLQGVWAGTYVPGWASDYTHNGNVPSAIASMMRGNMPELMLAYTSYIESIVPWMEINAKNMFGCRGIVLPSRSTTNGLNNAMNPNFAGGFWVGGAAWAAHFFYDYYEYTGDEKFLEEHALPFMEKAAVFFEDYLYEGPDGKWIFSPTQSPENTPGNSNSQGSFNATMDVAAAKELLNNIIIASKKLGKNKNKIDVWENMLAKMPEYMINEDGIIKEWLTPKLTNRDKHRHCSQYYPLFDYMGEEIADSPELQSAFKKSIDFKLKEHWGDNKRGFMSFGLVQLGQTATSLGESEMSYTCLKHLVNRFWLNNLASMHNHKTLFNMDISGGMPDVIIKMLANSRPGAIELLPALPKAWPSGTVEGILCRGQIEIKSMTWSANKIKVSLVSGKKQTVILEAPDDITEATVKKGKAIVKKHFVKEGLFSKRRIKDSIVVKLPANEEISLEIELK